MLTFAKQKGYAFNSLDGDQWTEEKARSQLNNAKDDCTRFSCISTVFTTGFTGTKARKGSPEELAYQAKKLNELAADLKA